MKDRERNRPTRISLAACQPCRRTYDVTPGGVECSACGRPCVQAVVILPRGESPLDLLNAAATLLLTTLERMAAAAPTR